MHPPASAAALFALVALTPLCLAQGQVVAEPPELLSWPSDWAVSSHAPLLDAQGVPVPRRVRAAGLADLDNDGNRDAWFMTDVDATQTQLHALLCNSGDLGRFRPWGDFPVAARPDAASYHPRDGIDMILAVDPTSTALDHFFFARGLGGDPRVNGMFAHTPGWPVGLGCYEIETADHDGDGHDDLAVLRDAGGGVFEIKTIAMDNPFGGLPSPQRERTFALPVRPERLVSADVDGDRRADAAAYLPGLGVLVLRESGNQLVIHEFFPLTGGLRELFAGDADDDGRDEIGLVLDTGVILLHGTATPTVLPNPVGVFGLTAARCVDADRDGLTDLVATPATGTALILHRRRASGFLAPLVHTPASAPPPGAGAQGLGLFTADFDRDGDLDLAVQLRDLNWVSLRSRFKALAPLVTTVVHEGRFSESYISERLDVTVPPSWRTAGIDTLEFGIYMRQPNTVTRPWVLWAHTTIPMPANAPLFASIRLLYLVDLTKLPLLTNAYLYAPQGFTVSGDTLVTVHGKAGRQRFESSLVFHEGRGDENKSTLGVQWKVLAAPPVPKADAQLLPFD